MSGELDTLRKRARYRAGHRGTKELDILLSGFAEAQVPDMTQSELTEFEALMAMPEPQLQKWLVSLTPPLGGDVPRLIDVVRAFHGLK